jgi:hypothetical protein
MILDPRRRLSGLLYGRENECQVLDALLAATREGDASAICLHGEPGIGKTELLNHAVTSAGDFRVLRTSGTEAEMELAYASLQEFFRPDPSSLGQLPAPQRKALEIVLGRQDGVAPDPMLAGLALLNMLSALSGEHPVLCVVDDAQWLDSSSAQVIGFAARHASKDAIAFLFAARRLTDEIRGLPQLAVGVLGDRDARALLATVLPDRLDDRVIDRVIAETHGNPLAILELPKGLSPAQLAGGFGLPVAVTLADQIEESYRRRLARLPVESRRLLLIVAADPTGNPEIIWRAADELGIDEEAAEAVEKEGLIEFGERVVFHHPLVRSAVYNTASPKDRREVHRALDKRRIGTQTPIAGYGTLRRQPSVRTRVWLTSWKRRRNVLSRVGDLPPQAPSWSGRSGLRAIPSAGLCEPFKQLRQNFTRERSTQRPHWRPSLNAVL